MVFEEFIRILTQRMSSPLPGLPVQLRMSSNHRLRELMDFSAGDHAVKSSVLILLYPGRITGIPTFVVTQRHHYEGVHGGQISLPGGRFEPEDKELLRTALREAREEIGVETSLVQTIGKLTELYIPPSNYLVQPFVGYTLSAPDFIAQPAEVAEIIEVPVEKLMDENNLRQRKIEVRGMHIEAPCYVIGQKIIWGATAMILSEFKEILSGMRL
jgi:8-oxo-dGTP pyrophosphatase MutT (NUDIX family)